ncbi:MAG TPA: hypothetical protein VN645_16345, partial [Steroidobacteraceae bacterium]|nr:hypothetical protein [Steroidobacteraceae bacterium]
MIAKQPPSLPPPEPAYGMQFPAIEEESSGGAGFTLAQLWHMVRAHLWLSIASFVVLLGIAFLLIQKMPKSYDATAALIVNIDNAD